MKRPTHLPNFNNPPLNEVVLDVQFSPIRGYRQIYAGEVWALFRERFPDVQEHPPLPPAFETFGPQQQNQLKLELLQAPTHPRFWFVEPEEAELIQFQPDRLIHNWRKRGKSEGEYRRFEPIAADYERELQTLDKYFVNRFGEKLNINQCEVTYINSIELGSRWSWRKPGEIFRFLQFEDRDEVTDLNVGFRRVLTNHTGEPFGRLVVEVQTAIADQNRQVFMCRLKVRGVPEDSTITAALKFMASGRELIVSTFTDITTNAAHESWERIN